MITVTVYWDTGKEDYIFENEDDARAFYVDALSKCGHVEFSVKGLPKFAKEYFNMIGISDVLDWLQQIVDQPEEWNQFYSDSEVKLLAEKTMELIATTSNAKE